MPIRNDKMATSDNKVLKMHVRNIRGVKLDMIYLFSNNRGHKNVEG